MTTSRSPDFDNPPLIETVIGVQFEQLHSLTAADLGWFWSSELQQAWQRPQVVPVLPDQYELLPGRPFPIPTVQFDVGLLPPARIACHSIDRTEMLQAQPSRFVFNWLRQPDEDYPHWNILRPRFDGLLDSFERFLAKARFAPLKINQWEVIYVNRIPQGELWERLGEIGKIFPRLSATDAVGDDLHLSGLRSSWAYDLADQTGRVHLEISHSPASGTHPPSIHVNLTARGEVRPDLGRAYGDGLEAGHTAIVQTFRKITSASAHKFWGLRQ